MNSILKILDWKKHMPLLALFVVSLCVCSYTIMVHFSLSETIRLDNNQLAAIKQRAVIAIDSQKKIAVYDKQFERFIEQGYVSDPQRLKWLEALREMVSGLHIPQVRFTLSPTVNESDLNGDDSYVQEKSSLSLTPMTLEMELMHEGDFYDFMQRYQSIAPGVFQVDDCEIKRVEKNTTTKPIRLLARCQIIWLNYRDIREDWKTTL